MTTPPQLQISRAGISNFPEIRKWAQQNSEPWVRAERWRKMYAWTDEEFLEVLACELLIAHAASENYVPPAVLPPDPEVPPLFQLDEEEPSRIGCAILIGTGLTLALVAGVLAYLGWHVPPAICGTAAVACGVRAFKSTV